jgi:hypothetical protein
MCMPIAFARFADGAGPYVCRWLVVVVVVVVVAAVVVGGGGRPS